MEEDGEELAVAAAVVARNGLSLDDNQGAGEKASDSDFHEGGDEEDEDSEEEEEDEEVEALQASLYLDVLNKEPDGSANVRVRMADKFEIAVVATAAGGVGTSSC